MVPVSEAYMIVDLRSGEEIEDVIAADPETNQVQIEIFTYEGKETRSVYYPAGIKLVRRAYPKRKKRSEITLLLVCLLWIGLLGFASAQDLSTTGRELSDSMHSKPIAHPPYLNTDEFFLNRAGDLYRALGTDILGNEPASLTKIGGMKIDGSNGTSAAIVNLGGMKIDASNATSAAGLNLGIRRSAALNPTPYTWFVRDTGNDTADCLTISTSCLTINAALNKAFLADANRQSVVIDIGSGTFLESVAVNGQMPGAIGNGGFLSALSAPMVYLKGAGSGVTTIAGPTNNLCYTLLANNYGSLAISGMTVTSVNSSTCSQSGLYAQFFGTLYVYGDVKVGPVNQWGVFGEEYGSIIVTPGCMSCSGLTFSGNAYGAIGLSATSMFQSDSTINFAGSPTYTYGFAAGENSLIKLSGNPPLSGSFGGPAMFFSGNSTMLNYHSGTWAGSPGYMGSGSRWEGLPPAATLVSTTGLGSTGTVSIQDGSSPYSGLIYMTPGGTGIASLGTVTISMPYMLYHGACTVGWNENASASFQLGSVFWYSVNSNQYIIKWSNGGSTALTSGQSYPLTWVCNSN